MRYYPRVRSRVFACLVCALLTLASACAGDPTAPPSAPGRANGPNAGIPSQGKLPTTSPLTSTPSASASSSSLASAHQIGPSPTKQGHRSILVIWTKSIGVAGGAGGGAEDVIAALAEGKCGQAEVSNEPVPGAEHSLYEGVIAACSAALEGRGALWRRAESILDEATAGRRALNCFEEGALSLLRRLVLAHQKDPRATLVPDRSHSSETPPCPRIREITPDHGSPEGGYEVRLSGEFLRRSPWINFWQTSAGNDLVFLPIDRVRARYVDDSVAYITVPKRKEASETVAIWPERWPFKGTNTPPFTYDITHLTAEPSAPSLTSVPPNMTQSTATPPPSWAATGQSP